MGRCKEYVRAVILFGALLVACSGSAGADRGDAPSATPLLRSSETAVGATTAPCERTTAHDASGVITANGVVGVIGDTVTPSATALNEPLVIVRRGTGERDRVNMRFDVIGQSAPAKWVAYGVTAHPRPNPCGEFAFEAGWKPIGVAGSCWRAFIDGARSGLLLEGGAYRSREVTLA